jgi:circadian clock protein KaiC
MLFDLTGMLTSYETTVFLVGEYTEDDAKILPEFAIADGIVQFLRNAASTRDERFMRVLKLRGSSYLEGLHGCKITRSGLEVYPRLVTPEIPKNYSIVRKRVPSGVEGLDKIIGGGFLQGSTTVLAGPTGAGKTTLSLQFALEGINRNEKSLFVSFQENPTQLAEVTRALAKGKSADLKGLDFLYASPVELQIDSLVVKLFWRIQEGGVKRVVIDSIGDLGGATSDPTRLHNYLYSMIQHFAVAGITSILTFETQGPLLSGGKDTFGISQFSNMSDNIVLLGVPREPDFDQRVIRCLKARSVHHDHKPHPFEITEGGIRVL